MNDSLFVYEKPISRSRWRRDAVLLATAYNTGARVSELTAPRVPDVLLDRQAAVHLHGKGRKQRVIPLWKTTATGLRTWLAQISSAPGTPAFPGQSRGNGGAVVICVAVVIYVTAGPVPPTAWLSQPHAYYRVAATTTRLAASDDNPASPSDGVRVTRVAMAGGSGACW